MKSVLHTLCGALSSLWTPAIWFIKGISSLNVYRGGLVGSGKLVLLKGSVSSNNCTLHMNVAMMHPCTTNLDHQSSGCDRRAAPGQRTAGRSSAVAKPCTLCYPWTFSIRFTQRGWLRTVQNKSPKVTIRGASGGGLVRALRSIQGHCGRLRCWGRLQAGLLHLALGLWERWEAAPSSSINSARRHSQTSAGRHSSGYSRNGALQWRKCGAQKGNKERRKRKHAACWSMGDLRWGYWLLKTAWIVLYGFCNKYKRLNVKFIKHHTVAGKNAFWLLMIDKTTLCSFNIK